MASSMYLFLIGSMLILCQLQISWAAPGNDDPEPPRSSGDISIEKLSAEDQEKLRSTGRLSVMSVGDGIYVPGPIKNPCGQTWASWWKQNYWYFQCIANKNCTTYRGCWCNLCACYTFVVYPQNPPCPRWLPWDLTASSLKVPLYKYLNGPDEVKQD